MSRLAGSTQIRQFDVCVSTTSPLEICVLALLEPPSLEVAKHPPPFHLGRKFTALAIVFVFKQMCEK